MKKKEFKSEETSNSLTLIVDDLMRRLNQEMVELVSVLRIHTQTPCNYASQ